MRPHVLILANQAPGELAPLCRTRSFAELPLAGKPILEHALEAVAGLAPASVTVAATGDVVRVRAFVAAGERWGIDARVIGAAEAESAPDVIARTPALHRRGLLVLRCDHLLDLDLGAALGALARRAPSNGSGVRCERSGLLWLPSPADATATRAVRLDLDRALPLDTLQGYHGANLAAARGDFPQLVLGGRPRSGGLRQGYQTRAHPRVVESGHAHLGNRCVLHPDCRLAGDVVLGDGVGVGRGTRLENTLVLDDTMIGDGLELREAIVAGDTLVRVDTGTVVRVSDRFLLCARGEGLYAEYLVDPLNRLAGGVLLALTAPALLAATLAIVARHGRQGLTSRLLLGNRRRPGSFESRPFRAYALASGEPWLRHLPMLLAVVGGDLRLYGLAPLNACEPAARIERWERVRDRQPAGLLGPTQRRFGFDAEHGEWLCSDALVAAAGITPREALLLITESAVRVTVGLGETLAGSLRAALRGRRPDRLRRTAPSRRRGPTRFLHRAIVRTAADRTSDSRTERTHTRAHR